MAITGVKMNMLPKELVDQEVQSICNRYKIGHELVKKHIYEIIQHHPKLIQKIQENKSEHISRLKVYKRFIKDVKKTIYYQLRQYHNSANEGTLKQQLADVKVNSDVTERFDKILMDLLASHVSSKERLPYYEAFYRQLFYHIDSPQTIIDIGCGMHPLSYPFKKNVSLKTYLAIDKDSSVIDILHLFAPHILPIQLKPVCIAIQDIDWSDYLDQGMPFDLAIMLKLIPVLHRQNKSSIKQLSQIPAKKILLTGNIESMTRHENIRRKEEKVLKNYIEMTGRKVIASFQIENEFGMLI